MDYEELTGQDLGWNVQDWRHAGVSWRQIADHVIEDTDGRVRLTHETLRQWYGELEGAA